MHNLAATAILFNILEHCLDNLHIPLLIKLKWLNAQKVSCRLCSSSLPAGIQPRWLVLTTSSQKVCAEAESSEGYFLLPIPVTPVPGFALFAMPLQGWPQGLDVSLDTCILIRGQGQLMPGENNICIYIWGNLSLSTVYWPWVSQAVIWMTNSSGTGSETDDSESGL